MLILKKHCVKFDEDTLLLVKSERETVLQTGWFIEIPQIEYH
jgi:hypothetical protein